MCTVTYIPGKNRQDFTLTSNRDERIYRPTLPPEIYHHENTRVYPENRKIRMSYLDLENDSTYLISL